MTHQLLLVVDDVNRLPAGVNQLTSHLLGSQGLAVRHVQAYSLQMEASTREHWFRFRGKAGEVFTIETSTTAGDTNIGLFDRNGAELGSDDDGGSRGDRREWRCPSDDEFFVRIGKYSEAAQNPASYQLTISVPPSIAP